MSAGVPPSGHANEVERGGGCGWRARVDGFGPECGPVSLTNDRFSTGRSATFHFLNCCQYRRHRTALHAPGSSQRSLPHQIVGIVILRCPLFVAVGRLRAVPTIIPGYQASSQSRPPQSQPTANSTNSIVSLPLRRLPHRQYSATVRTVHPLHLLGHPIILASIHRPLYHCSVNSSRK